MTEGAAPDMGRVEEMPEGRMSTTTRFLATAFVVVSVAFWIFAFSPWARDLFTAPDQLEDEALVAAIDDVCAAARTDLFELPPARTATTPAERAEILVAANETLRQMRADLAMLPVDTPEDRRLVNLWLDDWDIYLGDRDTHINRLLTEGDVRFFNTVDNGVFIHERMDGFARVNNMDNCETPGDV